MTPERFRRIEGVFHAALERQPNERHAFLAAECGDDRSLHDEVSSLLAQPGDGLLTGGAAALLPSETGASPGRLQGKTIGDYVLGTLIGSGAMGEVYRAHDSRLGRDVAVKILAPGLVPLADRMARFEREARILASINHPHIAAIHDIVTSADVTGLVLELVDGVTLAERLHGRDASGHAGDGRGPLSIPETLEFARQIADALQAAHRRGVIHRDLKPENLKISAAGTIKVLDFGLAKIEEGHADAAMPAALVTGHGVMLGTVAYMSPEQARGRDVDKRTDIWAFGCVLYEMLTGERAFPGDTSADVLTRITSSDPDWSRLPAGLPARMRQMLRRCLVKDPDRRLHDIADARLDIEDTLAGVDDLPAQAPPARTGAGGLVVAALIVGLIAAAGAVASLVPWNSAVRLPVHAAIPLPDDVSIWEVGRGSSVALSPDGRLLAFAGVSNGTRQVFIRSLTDGSLTRVAGSEGAVSPFFSPDSRWIGFIDDANGGSLKRVPIEGGTPRSIVARAGTPEFVVTSASWNTDDTIVFASTSVATKGLWRVPAAGGRATLIAAPRAGEYNYRWPQMLPDGRGVLFTIWSNTGFEGGRLAVLPNTGGEPRVIVDGASHGRVVTRPDGGHWLVYARTDGLMAARIDLPTLRVGGAVPVLDRLLVNLSGGAHFSASDHGVLAYVPGGLDEADKTALWVDRSGAVQEVGVVPGLGFQYRLSPDGTQIVRPNVVGPTRDLYVDTLRSRGPARRLSFGDSVNYPVWTQDGSRIVYASGVSPANLFWRPADGTGPEQRLTTSPNKQLPSSVSADGRLAFVEHDPETGNDIWVMPLDGRREPELLVGTPAAEESPQFSPDSRWIAYHVRDGNSAAVFLTSVSQPRRQIAVSTGEGWNPLWSRDGREIYYRDHRPTSGEGHMIAVALETNGETPAVGTPRVLFPTPYQGEGDIGPDGRFLLLHRTRQVSPARFIPLVLDWCAELDARPPVR